MKLGDIATGGYSSTGAPGGVGRGRILKIKLPPPSENLSLASHQLKSLNYINPGEMRGLIFLNGSAPRAKPEGI